jgi:hypothetical protein
MGLLDSRTPPNYKENLKKLLPVDGFLGRFLAGKPPGAVKAAPRYSYPIFGNTMLSQQALPGALKVLLVMGAVYLPGIIIHSLSARRHSYRPPAY